MLPFFLSLVKYWHIYNESLAKLKPWHVWRRCCNAIMLMEECQPTAPVKHRGWMNGCRYWSAESKLLSCFLKKRIVWKSLKFESLLTINRHTTLMNKLKVSFLILTHITYMLHATFFSSIATSYGNSLPGAQVSYIQTPIVDQTGRNQFAYSKSLRQSNELYFLFVWHRLQTVFPLRNQADKEKWNDIRSSEPSQTCAQLQSSTALFKIHW